MTIGTLQHPPENGEDPLLAFVRAMARRQARLDAKAIANANERTHNSESPPET